MLLETKIIEGLLNIISKQIQNYIIVFDVTNPTSYNNIKNRLKELEINNITNPDVIVGNKIDLVKGTSYVEWQLWILYTFMDRTSGSLIQQVELPHLSITLMVKKNKK